MNGRIHHGLTVIALAGILVVLLHVDLVSAAPPGNDVIEQATLIANLPYSETLLTIEATTAESDPLPSCVAARSATVWYAFSASQDGIIDLSTAGSSYETSISAYTAVNGGLAEVACAGSQSPLRLRTLAGQTYLIMVAGFPIFVPYAPPEEGGGTLEISVTQVIAPANDDFADSALVNVLPYTETVDISGASLEPGEQLSPDCAAWANPDRSVWYTLTPTTGGRLRAGASASFTIFVAVWTGDGLGNLTELGCANYSSFDVDVQAGTTYYVQAGNVYAGEGGPLSINLELIPPPANDQFNAATPVTGLPYNDTAEVTSATIEPEEPQNCHFKPQTLWYSFTPTMDLSVAASASGSDPFGVQLAAYQAAGPGITDLTFLGCDLAPYGFLGLDLQAERTYYFQIGSTYFSTGLVPNDDFINATEIAGLPFNGQSDIRAASLELNEPSVCGNLLQSVWYSFAPAENPVLEINTSGSEEGSLVGIYQASGPAMEDLSSIGCLTSGSFYLNAQTGTTYYFQHGREFSSNASSVQLNIQAALPPANDDFANAPQISAVPFFTVVDNSAATTEPSEPSPSCVGSISKTFWFAFTPDSNVSITALANEWWSFVAAYTGDNLASLGELGCRYYSPQLLLQMEANQTYYFQVGTWNEFGSGPVTFQLDETPPPTVDFYWIPGDPNIFDQVTFCDSSIDPVNAGFASLWWDFGAGPISGQCVNYQFPVDGDHTVWHKIETLDGRAAEMFKTVEVRTHDVAITKFRVPRSASVGQTRKIAVGLRNTRYDETVTVELWKSVPGGFEFVGSLSKLVPVRPGNRTTGFQFRYTFTEADAAIGKVTFKAVAILTSARDALPADNEAMARPTRVTR